MAGSILFSPLTIGSMTVPNRIMQTAHSKQYSDRHESQRETDYYVRRARGGCGLFVAGNFFVHSSGSIRWFEDGFRSEAVAPNRALTDAVHEAGSRILVQLNHHGAQANPDGPEGPRPVYSSSRLLSPSTGHATREASRVDIRSLVDGWARSAVLARESGFDGVEIHMAHSYLLHQFLSPLYNARADEYGGDLEGRTRFPREVLRAVRAAVGEDYTVGIRIVADEAHPGGLDAADLRQVIQRLRAEEKIDFLDLAAGGYHNVHYVFPSSPMPVAWLREQTAAVKAENPDIAVFGVGSALSVENAEEVLTSGVADMVALTRAQLADPDLATKLRTGRTDLVRHCIRLNQGCLGRGSTGLPVSCTVNPVAGREADREERPTVTTTQHWVVVGGGPAGMRAATELAEGGHRVTLLEQDGELGGQLRWARLVPGRESIQLLVDDLERDLARLGVDVRMNTLCDTATIAALEPDGVVLATGSRAPETAGVAFSTTGDLGDTISVPETVASPQGQRVAIVDDDGTSYGAGAALALAAAGVEVLVITPFETVFPHVRAGYDRQLLLERLSQSGSFDRRVSSVVTGRRGDTITLRDTLTGKTSEISGVDVVVLSTPREPVREPIVDQAGLPTSLRVVELGDRVYPRNIDAAIFDAVELAHSVGRVG